MPPPPKYAPETNHVKKRYSPQIGGVMVSHHNMVSLQMVSPQNGDTRGGPPPSLSDATGMLV